MDEKRTNASGRARRFCASEEDAGREAAERRICEQSGLALYSKQSLVLLLVLLLVLVLSSLGDWRKLESGEASEDWSLDQSLSWGGAAEEQRQMSEQEDGDGSEDEQLVSEQVVLAEEEERPFSSRLSFPWI